MAATSNGRSADAPYPCASWRTPEVGDRNEIVSIASATITRIARTARRTIAVRTRDGYGLGFERWSEEPSTATRPERFGGATVAQD